VIGLSFLPVETPVFILSYGRLIEFGTPATIDAIISNVLYSAD